RSSLVQAGTTGCSGSGYKLNARKRSDTDSGRNSQSSASVRYEYGQAKSVKTVTVSGGTPGNTSGVTSPRDLDVPANGERFASRRLEPQLDRVVTGRHLGNLDVERARQV